MKLPRREREILALLCQGKTSKEIAVELELAPSTVDHRIAALLVKVGVSSRLRLVIWVLQHVVDSESPANKAA
jgi:DNA-binding NarL/FixJ family response regulator